MIAPPSSVLTSRPPERRAYEPFGASRAAWRSARREVLLSGPADCIAGETRIYDPVQDSHIPIKELYEKQIAPVVQTLWGPIQAEIPFKKGIDRLYRLTTTDGRSCLVTGHHLVLTPNGWTFVSACSSVSLILVSAPIPQVKCLEQVPPVSLQDVHHWNYRDRDYQDDYLQCYYRDDGQLQLAVNTAQVVAPLQGDAHVHTRDEWHKDAQVVELGYIPVYQFDDLRATLDYLRQSVEDVCTRFGALQENQQHDDGSFQYAARSLYKKPLPLPIGVYPQYADNMLHSLNHWQQSLHTLRDDGLDGLSPEQRGLLSLYSNSLGMSQEWCASVLLSDAYTLSLYPSYKYDYTVQWTTVSSIEYERTDEYFDLHIPGAEHYLAEGIWHHNTGKSRLWLEKLHYCCNKYPGMRGCMIRKTRKSLTQTAMVTYEQKVLPEGALGKRPGQIQWRTGEQEYRYPNGSIIAVSGLDDPEKLKSSEWDFLYFQEATEGTLHEWEMLTRGLRNGAMPWQQLAGDCNPSYPHHWLKSRCDAGMTLMLLAQHSDNPSFTPERRAVLEALTGVRYWRLYKGLWVAAEGVVYEDWNPAYHVVTREQLHKWEWLYTDGSYNWQVIKRCIGGIDWGFTNPGVLSVFGIDHDNRLLLLKEVYQTRKTIDWWIPQAQALEREFSGHIEKWKADPSRPDYIAQFNAAGLPCEGAKNSIKLGIDFFTTRLKDTSSDRPRFAVYEYAQTERDEALAAVDKPTSILQEFEEYVWPEDKDGKPRKEEPVDENNHALDAARYVVMDLDAGQDIDELDKETAQAISRFRGL